VKVSACIICKTPSRQLARAVASVRPLVDEVVVAFNAPIAGLPEVEGVDRYSTCEDVNAPEDCPPGKGCNCKQGDLLDFAALRNASFLLGAGEWAFWLDSDDTLEFRDVDALRKLASTPGKHRYGFSYAYGDSKFSSARLVPRETSEWQYPIHELLGTSGFNDRYEVSDAVVIRHERSSEGEAASRTRNVRIALHHAGDPRYAKDGRFQYYLGQSLRSAGQLEGALLAYERCLRTSRVPDEKYLAAEWASRICVDLERYEEAARWAHLSTAHWPERANGFLQAGHCYSRWARATGSQNRVYLAATYFRIGFSLPVSSSVLPMRDVEEVTREANEDYLSCLKNLGDLQKSFFATREAFVRQPKSSDVATTQKRAAP
jgi:tetratricopeptide (TPR) repeat protein